MWDMSVNWVRLAFDLDDGAKLLAPSHPPAGITLTTLQEFGDSKVIDTLSTS
jgi:hypothetical protein